MYIISKNDRINTVKSMCGMSYDDICKVIGNVSIAAVSRLCVDGFKLFMEDEVYKEVVRGESIDL